MGRSDLAYLLIAGLIVSFVAIVLNIRHNSHERTYKRRQKSDDRLDRARQAERRSRDES